MADYPVAGSSPWDATLKAYIDEVAAGGGGSAVTSVNGDTGAVVLSASDVGAVPTTRTVAGKPLSANVALVKGDVGLGNVDNTSDAAKPVSTATQTALNTKLGALLARAPASPVQWVSNFTGALTSSVANISEHRINGTALAWLNEWGAFRAKIPPYLDAAFRAIVDEGETPPAGQPAFHINDRRSSAPSPNAWARTWTGRLIRNGITMSDAYVATSEADPNIANLPPNSIVVIKDA